MFSDIHLFIYFAIPSNIQGMGLWGGFSPVLSWQCLDNYDVSTRDVLMYAQSGEKKHTTSMKTDSMRHKLLVDHTTKELIYAF